MIDFVEGFRKVLQDSIYLFLSVEATNDDKRKLSKAVMNPIYTF